MAAKISVEQPELPPAPKDAAYYESRDSSERLLKDERFETSVPSWLLHAIDAENADAMLKVPAHLTRERKKQARNWVLVTLETGGVLVDDKDVRALDDFSLQELGDAALSASRELEDEHFPEVKELIKAKAEYGVSAVVLGSLCATRNDGLALDVFRQVALVDVAKKSGSALERLARIQSIAAQVDGFSLEILSSVIPTKALHRHIHLTDANGEARVIANISIDAPVEEFRDLLSRSDIDFDNLEGDFSLFQAKLGEEFGAERASKKLSILFDAGYEPFSTEFLELFCGLAPMPEHPYMRVIAMAMTKVTSIDEALEILGPYAKRMGNMEEVRSIITKAYTEWERDELQKSLPQAKRPCGGKKPIRL